MTITHYLQNLNTITNKIQSQIQHLIYKNKSPQQKINYTTLYLTQMKYQLYSWIQSLFIKEKSYTQNSKQKDSYFFQMLRQNISQLKIKQQEALMKHKLHLLLKKKLNKMKKQSFMHSMDASYMKQSNISTISNNHSNQSNLFFPQNDNLIDNLQKSVIMFEKDLNIHNNHNHNQKSKFYNSFDMQHSSLGSIQKQKNKQTIFLDEHNISAISQYSVYGLETIGRKECQGQEKNGNGFNNAKLIDELTPFSSYVVKDEKQVENQQQRMNKDQPKDANIIEKKQISEKIKNVTSKEQTDNACIPQKKTLTMKKKKKSIYSNLGQSSSISNLNANDLLGNLLQQSYQQTCLQSQSTK